MTKLWTAGEHAQNCQRCGKGFIPGSNRAKYCPECAKRAEKENHRRRQRKYKGKR